MTTPRTPETEAVPDAVPICFDLDGTLIRADLFQEGVALLLGRNPLMGLLIPWWYLLGRRPRVKTEVHARVSVDPGRLPYAAEVCELARAQKASGRAVLFVTAADEAAASRVAAHLGCFDEVIGTRDGFNLLGENKRRRLVERFGESGFDYVGDSSADLKVWPSARIAIVANRSERFAKRVRRIASQVERVGEPSPSARPIWHYAGRAARIAFLESILAVLFVPSDMVPLAICLVASFGLCGVAAALFDDVVDLVGGDRDNARYQLRPLVAWRWNVLKALAAAAGAGLVGVLLAGAGAGWKGACAMAICLLVGGFDAPRHRRVPGLRAIAPFICHGARLMVLFMAVGLGGLWFFVVASALAFGFALRECLGRLWPGKALPTSADRSSE